MPARVHVRASKRTSALCLLLLIGMSSLCFCPPPPPDHPDDDDDELGFLEPDVQSCQPDPEELFDNIVDQIHDVFTPPDSQDEDSDANSGSPTKK